MEGKNFQEHETEIVFLWHLRRNEPGVLRPGAVFVEGGRGREGRVGQIAGFQAQSVIAPICKRKERTYINGRSFDGKSHFFFIETRED